MSSEVWWNSHAISRLYEGAVDAARRHRAAPSDRLFWAQSTRAMVRRARPGVGVAHQKVVHVLRGSVTLLVVVGLFWTATNFATVEGTELARAFPGQVATLPSVEVDSAQPLDIVAPGVEVSCLGKARDGAITTAACATAEDQGRPSPAQRGRFADPPQVDGPRIVDAGADDVDMGVQRG